MNRYRQKDDGISDLKLVAMLAIALAIFASVPFYSIFLGSHLREPDTEEILDITFKEGVGICEAEAMFGKYNRTADSYSFRSVDGRLSARLRVPIEEGALYMDRLSEEEIVDRVYIHDPEW